MLGPKLEDCTDAYDDVFQIGVRELFSLPLVLLGLALPECARQLGKAVLKATTDAHDLVKLHSDIRVGCLPDIVILELPLNSAANHFYRHAEDVFHPHLGVGRVDGLVLPDLVEDVLDRVNQRIDSAQV